MNFPFFLYIPLFLALYDTFHFLMFLVSKFKTEEITDFKNVPPLTVIIPAKNEEKTIKKTISSVFNQNYPKFNVIVIDDGSSDKTWDKINELSKKYSNLRKIKTNGKGKWKCLNLGISKTKRDIIIIDADTILKEKALLHMGHKLKNNDMVAGNLKVERESFLSKIQAIEHLRISMFREYESLFNKVSMVPGAIGGYRKKVFDEIKYEKSLTEDFNLYKRAKSKDYTIGYASRAQAVTKMHNNLKNLIKQRIRWRYGNLKIINLFSKEFINIIYGDLIVFLDILTFIFIIIYPSIILFFIYETIMILTINWIEENSLWVENLFYPIPWLFLSIIYLYINIRGYWKIFIGMNHKQKW